MTLTRRRRVAGLPAPLRPEPPRPRDLDRLHAVHAAGAVLDEQRRRGAQVGAEVRSGRRGWWCGGGVGEWGGVGCFQASTNASQPNDPPKLQGHAGAAAVRPAAGRPRHLFDAAPQDRLFKVIGCELYGYGSDEGRSTAVMEHGWWALKRACCPPAAVQRRKPEGSPPFGWAGVLPL
jgi:hypothetical protein